MKNKRQKSETAEAKMRPPQGMMREAARQFVNPLDESTNNIDGNDG
jgi:hypothetical protein